MMFDKIRQRSTGVLTKGTRIFSILILSSALLAVQTVQAESNKAYKIKWRGHVLHTNQPAPSIPDNLKITEYPETIKGYYFVQFKTKVTKQTKKEIKDAGGEVMKYVPNNTYIVRMPALEKARIAELPGVQYVGIYQPVNRISTKLLKRFQGQAPIITPKPGVQAKRAGTEPEQTQPEFLWLTVLVFKGENLPTIKSDIAAAGGTILSAKEYKRWVKIRVKIPPENAPQLPMINGIMWIEEYGMFKTTNDIARGIIDVAQAWAPVNGLRGANQIIAVADSGLDSGVNNATMHNDFQGRITSIHSWPVQGLFGEQNANADDGAAADNYGHGTHVAGSALGNGNLSGGTYSGIAPDANLVFQALLQFSDFADNESDGLFLTGIPDNLNDLFQEAYDDGARIHSNSWGQAVGGEYTVDSEEVDQFIWDNPDMLILYSAGNSGRDADQNNVVDLNSLGSPATAKNCLTVGATENNRPGLTNTWSSGAGNILNQDRIANNPDGMAFFSSRGPSNADTPAVNDDRFKPDLVAPGTAVVSTRTRATPLTTWFTDDMEGGVGGWVAGGTWARTNAVSHNGNWSWNDGSAGNYADNTNITLTSAVQNLNGGGNGNKYLQFWYRYDLGTGDTLKILIRGDGGNEVWLTVTGIQNDWELLTLGLGPMRVGWNWYNFSDAPDLEVEFILESNNDGNTGDGVYIDDVRIVEGAFIGGTLSDYGIAAAGTPEDDNYILMGGTSMSTPLTAGSAAIVRQYYTDERGLGYMSGALLRATLINGAEDITPGQYGAGANQEIPARPNNVEGWGRVNINNTLFPPAPTALDFKDELAGVDDGENHEYTLNITDNTVPAIITMVYHDSPGADIINHLDLTVTGPGPGGATFFPNGLAGVDDQNNVEQIVIQNPQVGEYAIRVDGQNVPEGPQPYALVTRAGGVMADRDPVDIMLALDISGSMQDPAAPGGESKLSVLQQATELFVQLWTAVAAPGDRLGVAYFKTQVNKFQKAGVTLLDVWDNAEDIITDINAQTTNWNNMTAMGGGLQTSINDLTDALRPRNIILFTDGMQNVNPMVQELAGGDYKIDNEAGRTNSNINPTAPPTQLDGALGIKVNTIGVGATDAYMDLMDNIAASTNGLSKLTQAPDNDLRRFFVEDLIDALREFSPQLLGYRHGTMAGSSQTETFTVSKSAQKIIFKVSWAKGQEMNFTVEKDGINMTQAGKTITGSFYKIWDIKMPYKYKLTRVSSDGDWKIKISGNAGTKYEVAAIVDEPLLDYDFSLDQKDYAVGDSLKINTRLTFGNKPVINAKNVTATILCPKTGIGTLLSTNPTPDEATLAETAATPDQKKFQQLSQQPAFYNKLQPAIQTVIMKNNGDGSYAAEYTNTIKPGTYTVIFKVAGYSPDIGQYQRTEIHSTLVRFGKAELEKSEPKVELLEETATVKKYLLTICPKDKYGNYIGPGYKDKITFTVSEGSLQGVVEDLLDGRYTQKVFVAAGKDDPTLTVTVVGEVLYEGPLSEMAVSKKFGVSLHGGAAVPIGNLANDFDPGLNLMLDFGYDLSSQLSILAYLNHNAFTSKTAGLDDTYWLNFSADLKYKILTSVWTPYIQGGLGYYVPKTGDSGLGVNLGLGLDYDASSSLTWELGADYHNVLGEDIQFLQGHIGVIFKF